MITVKDLKGKTVGAAVSGGLDSSTLTRWLTDNGVKVICFVVDLAQPDEQNFNEIKKRLLIAGAKEVVVVDGKNDLAKIGVLAIQAQAKYEGGYWNTTALARHITTELILREMKKRKINIFTHGATGRGNDQVRFQLVTNMLEPDITVYAPWRDDAFLKAFGGRKEMIDFCKKRKIPIKATMDKPYSTDANMLGLTHEAGKLESLATPADFVKPEMGTLPKDAPDKEEQFYITFQQGFPVRINGKKTTLLEAFLLANKIGGRNGVGIGIHVVENRFVGIKSRGVYEMPGIELLGKCYEFLLQLILERRSRRLFQFLSEFIAEQVYQGYFYDPASNAAMSAIKHLASFVSGNVYASLYRGNVFYQKIEQAKNSLYSETTGSMEKVGSFNHADSEGFLRVLGVTAKALNAAKQIDLTPIGSNYKKNKK
ncbi:MAG: argininosuccinate synthase [Candidatus Levyibacteriota bacterium]